MGEYDGQYCGPTYACSGVDKHSLKEGGLWFQLSLEADIGYRISDIRKCPKFYLYFCTFPIHTTNNAGDEELNSIRNRRRAPSCRLLRLLEPFL